MPFIAQRTLTSSTDIKKWNLMSFYWEREVLKSALHSLKYSKIFIFNFLKSEFLSLKCVYVCMCVYIYIYIYISLLIKWHQNSDLGLRVWNLKQKTKYLLEKKKYFLSVIGNPHQNISIWQNLGHHTLTNFLLRFKVTLKAKDTEENYRECYERMLPFLNIIN